MHTCLMPHLMTPKRSMLNADTTPLSAITATSTTRSSCSLDDITCNAFLIPDQKEGAQVVLERDVHIMLLLLVRRHDLRFIGAK